MYFNKGIERSFVMKIRLFAPLTDEIVIKFYADNLARGTEENVKNGAEHQLEQVQLKNALVHSHIDPDLIAPTPLDADELGHLIAEACSCYERMATKMTGDELAAYHIRLAVTNLDGFARVIEREMNKRELPHYSTKQLKAAQQDMAEIAKPDEDIEWGDADHSTNLAEVFKVQHAWATPDSEHDPRLHETLKPQMRTYKEHYWPVNTGG